MEKKVRKYYKIIATRFPPYYPINDSYDMYEYVYGYSEESARNAFIRYHRNGFGHYVIKSCEEIPKSEFKGHHNSNVL